ncbi:MAG: SDR family oxidoreductase [Solirubrobacterales bacterium]|nr:SDR family oxidoreductase [Solirubrobacterales bacterium]
MPAAKVVVVTGASSGFGAMSVRALADSDHTVYAGMRDVGGHNADAARDLETQAGDLRALELDVQDDDAVAAAVNEVLARSGRIDVIVHNAGHMVLGPAEAFTPDQLAAVYDVNVLGAQRLNRAALPAMREQAAGLLVWVGSSSTRGGCPPFLGPYFAAKAAEDALAVSYAGELIRYGIDTTIVVPGAFTSGTNHFANAGTPDDAERDRAYDAEYGQLRRELPDRLGSLVPADAEAGEVADVIARVVDLPRSERPFRIHVDPSHDGSEIVCAVGDRIRTDFFHRVGIADLLPAFPSL